MAKAKQAKKPAKPKAKKVVKKRKVLRATPVIKAAAEKSAKRAAKGAPIKRKSGVAAAKPAAKKGRSGFVLYGAQGSTPTAKVALMLAMAGVPFEFKHVDMRAGAHRTPEFAKMNRYGQVPVLRHGELYLCQSGAILAYLAEALGRFAGRNPAERQRALEWLFWDQDRMASGVGWPRAFARFMPQDPAVVAFATGRGEQALTFLDKHFGISKFLAGTEPTIADIALFPWIATAGEGGFDMARWPNVGAWGERMMRLSGVKHPYELLPAEDAVIGG